MATPSPGSSSSSSSSSLAPRPPSGHFTVRNIPLPAVEGHHKGTGSHTVQKLLVKPDSLVDPITGAAVSGQLEFESVNVHLTTMLYELDPPDVPNWFGVAIPDGVTDFTRPTIYFHPSPAGIYVDGFQNKTYLGMTNPDEPGLSDTERDNRRDWWNLFEYVDRLGHQLAGAVHFGATPNQILIFPFLASSVITSAGILPKHWLPIVSDILGDVRQRIAGIGGPLTVSNVAVAGFSFGHTAANAFRSGAKGQTPDLLSGVMKQVWGFDGAPSQDDLKSVPGKFKAIKYDQSSAANTVVTNVHLSAARWTQYPDPPPAEEPDLKPRSDLHHLIRDFMFLDASMKRDIPA
jgi:hypothetical protein